MNSTSNEEKKAAATEVDRDAVIGAVQDEIAREESPGRFNCCGRRCHFELTRPGMANAEVDSFRAWTVAFGAFWAGVSVIGELYSVGIFLVPLMDEYGTDLTSTSLVGTFSMVMFYIVGLFASHLADYLGCRPVITLGALLWVLGCMLGSLTTELWHSILTQGVLCGMGASFTYWPILSILPQWFRRYRATAMGFAVLGSGLGSVAISLGGAQMISQFGWRNALRIIGGVGFFLIIAIVFVERRVPVVHNPKGIFRGIYLIMRELLALNNARLFLCSVCLFQFCFFVPYTYLASYTINLGFTNSFGGFALAMLGIGSSCGRLIFGPLADYFGRLRVYRINVLFAAITVACWPASTDQSTILAFGFFYGAFGGGFAAMFAVVAADLWGYYRLSGVFTLVNMVCIPGAFAAGPLTGYIIDSTGSYTNGIEVAAAMMFGSFVLVCFVWKQADPQVQQATSSNTIIDPPADQGPSQKETAVPGTIVDSSSPMV